MVLRIWSCASGSPNNTLFTNSPQSFPQISSFARHNGRKDKFVLCLICLVLSEE